MKHEANVMRLWTAAGGVVWALGMGGCVAQQADLKTTERQLQKSIKQSNEELAQRGAQQRQELEEIKGQEIPRLRGDLDRVQHLTQDLQGKQEDLKQRSAGLEQQTKKLDQKLDHWAKNLETENTARYSQLRESLNAQDTKSKADRDQLRGEVNNRLDEINRQVESLRKDIIEVVQKSNAAFVKNVDVKLDEQRKTLTENQARTEQLANKFTQFSQALTGFRESLTGLNERVGQLNERMGQEEQANRAMTSKVEADAKASTTHINETTKAVTGHLNEVNKSVASVAQKLATRLDEQDQRLDTLTRMLDQMSREVQAQGAVKNGQHLQATKSTQQPAVAPVPIPPVPLQESPAQQEKETAVASVSTQVPEHTPMAVDRPAASEDSDEAAKPVQGRTSDRPDKAEYEHLLGLFRDGDLEGARRGFTAFLSQYPNSDLAPNARYWLGESHYGKKDYKQAIDAYDRVEMDYPQSEKVPAAILKKGYAYLALKDKKRASSAFKQVVTLYPKSLEAGKAYDKLAQLKETR
ncbi:MAG: putative TPR repeat containing exported protein periplasmic protein contains a protein prenylyltransferase domain [Nitrospira sp.]